MTDPPYIIQSQSIVTMSSSIVKPYGLVEGGAIIIADGHIKWIGESNGIPLAYRDLPIKDFGKKNSFCENILVSFFFRVSQKFGINYLKRNRLRISISNGILIAGEESIIDKVYHPLDDDLLFSQEDSPSSESLFLDTSIFWIFNQNFSIVASGVWQKKNNNDKKSILKLTLGIDVFFPISSRLEN